MKKIPKYLVVEFLGALSVSVLWFIYSKYMHLFSIDLWIDSLLAAFFIILLVVRDPSPRHFWFGFACLSGTAFSSLFEISTFTYILTSLSLGFFTLGIINLLIYNRE